MQSYLHFRETQPVHVVVDPLLSKVLRPHQREVKLPFIDNKPFVINPLISRVLEKYCMDLQSI